MDIIDIEDDRYDYDDLIGKTVRSAFYDLDDSGYPFVRIEFTDGSSIIIEEEGQCGSIAVGVIAHPNPGG